MLNSSRSQTPPPQFFQSEERLVLTDSCDDWDVIVGDGPVVATAIHDGHAMRPSLVPHLHISEQERRRDEDPLTGLMTEVGDVRVRVRSSRFQVDLNRPRDKALSTDPADTWGIRFWKGPLPAEELEQSLAAHDRFYAMFEELVERVIERHGHVFLLDIHSYNHCRDGAHAEPAALEGNPDIDLGATTLDRTRWGAVADRFAEALAEVPAGGRQLDVRENIRYPGGGHFPEWAYSRWGERMCAISVEYKKIYMDEWTAQADIGVVEDLRTGLRHAVAEVRGMLAR